MEPAPPQQPQPSGPTVPGSRERPVVIFNLRSSALLTTDVWVWPPPGDNIWGRTSGGHSSRPPRAGDGSHLRAERLMWSHYHHRLPAQLLDR